MEPRSRSLALSSCQVDGAKTPVRRSSGDSAVTESLWSKLVLLSEPLPTLTYRVPSGPVTGPPVAQTAPSRGVGTT